MFGSGFWSLGFWIFSFDIGFRVSGSELWCAPLQLVEKINQCQTLIRNSCIVNSGPEVVNFGAGVIMCARMADADADLLVVGRTNPCQSNCHIQDSQIRIPDLVVAIFR